MNRRLEDRLFLLGRPISPLYSAIMRLRRHLYDRGVLEAYSPGIPVVSIGNLLLGGTGKTPLVEEVVKWAIKRGMRPAVLTRGYKGTVGKGPKELIVQGEIGMGPMEAGDEPYMLALRVTQWCRQHGMDDGPIIIVGSNRVEAARLARERGADIIVLDDGFQHLRIKRDLDILLFPYNVDLNAQRVFPGGRLREPLDVARHADIIVISKVPHIKSTHLLAPFEEFFPKKELFPMVFYPESLIPLSGQRPGQGLERLEGKRVVAFCGIGDPESFKEMIMRLGCNLMDIKVFRDHHLYDIDDLLRLKRWSTEKKADMILTTEKDLVKLNCLVASAPIKRDGDPKGDDIFAIRLKVQVDPRLFSVVADHLDI